MKKLILFCTLILAPSMVGSWSVADDTSNMTAKEKAEKAERDTKRVAKKGYHRTKEKAEEMKDKADEMKDEAKDKAKDLKENAD